MKREPGYYWVKLHGEWVIAKWYFENGYHWDLFDGGMPFKDNHLEEIDERRIERQSEATVLPDTPYDPKWDIVETTCKPPQYLSDNPYLCKDDE